MQSVLASAAVITAVIGWVYALLLRRDGARPPGWTPVPRMASVLALLIFLAALPAGKPFQSGLTLGWGFLLGAALGIAVVVTGVTEAGVLSAAALGPSALLLVFHGYPNEALMGCAMGAVFVGAFARAALGRETRGVEAFSIGCAAVVVAARLGIEHFHRLTPDSLASGYWAIPGLLMAAGALAYALLPGDTGWRPLARGATGAAVSVTLLAILQAHWLHDLRWLAPACGALATALVAVVFHLEGDENSRPTLPAFAAALLILIAGPLAFRILQGYGMALAVVAGSIVAAPYLSRKNGLPAGLLRAALGIFLLLALGRLHAELRYEYRAMDFQMHYNLLAVALGAGAAFAAAAFAGRSAELPVASRMARATGLGIVVAATPMLLSALWDERAVAAMIAGGAVGLVVWMLLAAWSTGEDRAMALAGAPALYFAGAALIGIQLAGIVREVAATNTAKIGIVAVLGAAAVIRLMADAIGAARAKEEPSDEPTA